MSQLSLPREASPVALRAREPYKRVGLCSLRGWGEHNRLLRCSVCSSQGKSATSHLCPAGRRAPGGQFVPRGKDRKRAFLQPRLARDNAIVSRRSDRSHRRAALASGSLAAGQPAVQPAERRASPPVLSCPLPEARPRLGLRRKPGHSTRLRDFSFTSCAHPPWPGFCSQLAVCRRGILKLQTCRSADRVIAKIQYLAEPCCQH